MSSRTSSAPLYPQEYLQLLDTRGEGFEICLAHVCAAPSGGSLPKGEWSLTEEVLREIESMSLLKRQVINKRQLVLRQADGVRDEATEVGIGKWFNVYPC